MFFLGPTQFKSFKPNHTIYLSVKTLKPHHLIEEKIKATIKGTKRVCKTVRGLTMVINFVPIPIISIGTFRFDSLMKLVHFYSVSDFILACTARTDLYRLYRLVPADTGLYHPVPIDT